MGLKLLLSCIEIAWNLSTISHDIAELRTTSHHRVTEEFLKIFFSLKLFIFIFSATLELD